MAQRRRRLVLPLQLGRHGKLDVYKRQEVDGGATREVAHINKFIDYLNGSIDYGFGGPDVYRNWYVGGLSLIHI